MADAVKVKGARVQVDWINREIRRILEAQDDQKVDQTTHSIREVLDRWYAEGQVDAMASELRQIKGEMVGQAMNPSSLGDYVVHFFTSST